ncbi:MAG: glycosyltransferase family 39 protein [Candidatus Bathyarchaeota archaeon]|nr:glycosyltransferase family 39 protein [Candidatus Bathyarchaeota archaeon]
MKDTLVRWMRSLQSHLKVWLSDKWRLAFLAFVIAYSVFLLWNITWMSVGWDEVNHLNGGLLLSTGQNAKYMELNSFYPPLFDIVTTIFFKVLGVGVFSGRLVAVLFSLASVWAVFEFGRKLYNAKIAFAASILLAVMPGYIWLSRVAMIETMLTFFFTVSVLLFFMWLRTDQRKFLIWSGITLGLGVLTKYQIVIAGAVMLTGLVFLSRGYLKKRLSRFPMLILIVAAVVLPWIIVSYQVYASGMWDTWLYAMNIGNPDKTLYSLGFTSAGGNRLPNLFLSVPSFLKIPTFYLFEMTAPYYDIHPVSFYLYALGLAGLGLFAWRRKTEDKYLLIWFAVVYLFFTIIPNRQWRYIVPVFPVLAYAAANLLSSGFQTMIRIWENKHLSLSEKRFAQAAACILIALTAVGAFYTVEDRITWSGKDSYHVHIQEAVNFAADNLAPNDKILVLCTQNMFSQDTVRFFLNAEGKYNEVLVYPPNPVDTYKPNFDVNELISICQQNKVKYVFVYEYPGNETFFNSTITLQNVISDLYNSGNFSKLTDNNTYGFGWYPHRVFIMTFLGERQSPELPKVQTQFPSPKPVSPRNRLIR